MAADRCQFRYDDRTGECRCDFCRAEVEAENRLAEEFKPCGCRWGWVCAECEPPLTPEEQAKDDAYWAEIGAKP